MSGQSFQRGSTVHFGISKDGTVTSTLDTSTGEVRP